MQADILGKDGDAVGIEVIDNNNITHILGVLPNGEIRDHTVDEYDDAAIDRTTEESEHINQARRFAKYYLYRKRGYDTLPSLENPDRLTAVALLINQMSDKTFEQYFGEYYQQMRGHSGQAEPVMEIPSHVSQDNLFHYQTDVYLGLEEQDIETMAEHMTDESALDYLLDALDASTATDGGLVSLASTFESVAHDRDVTLDGAWADDLGLESVSGVHICWQDDTGQKHRVESDDSKPHREPDARLSIPPYDPDSPKAFQQYLVQHLLCQVRDCYIGMGIAPPEQVRILGPGQYKYSIHYQLLDMYEDYTDPSASISGWQEEHTPDEWL